MSFLPHHAAAPKQPRKSLVMIMGVQRSGTTALFDVLATSPGVSPRQETAGDEIYDDFFLRPEPAIRGILHALPGTVLLKPVRESERRSPLEVAEEYRDYDLRIIWLYRDPVNVFQSFVRFRWLEDSPDQALGFAKQWSKRNGDAAAAAEALGERLLVVRYEDLTNHRFLCLDVAKSLGLRVWTPLRGDSCRGRMSLPQVVQDLIDRHTRRVRARLDERRSIRSPSEATASASGVLPRLRGWLGRKRETKPTSRGSESILSTADYEELFRAADVGPIYRSWRQGGPVRLDAATGGFVAIGYDACRAIQAASVAPGHDEPFAAGTCGDASPRAIEFETRFANHRPELRVRIMDEVRATCSGLPANDPFQLSAKLSGLADRITLVWLGLPITDDTTVIAGVRRLATEMAAADFADTWKPVRKTLEGSSIVADLLRDGLLAPDETWAFVRDTCFPLQALPIVVEHAVASLGARPEVIDRLRADRSLIRPAIDEALRLTPIFLGIKRRLLRAVDLGGLTLPAGSGVDLLVGAANRDPGTFPDPDAFRLDRRSTPFFVFGETAPFCRIEDGLRPGCRHLVFDAATLVVSLLLARLQSIRTLRESMAFRLLPDGSCIQTLTAVTAMDDLKSNA